MELSFEWKHCKLLAGMLQSFENGRKICLDVNDVGELRSKLWVRGVATTGCGVAKWGVA